MRNFGYSQFKIHPQTERDDTLKIQGRPTIRTISGRYDVNELHPPKPDLGVGNRQSGE